MGMSFFLYFTAVLCLLTVMCQFVMLCTNFIVVTAAVVGDTGIWQKMVKLINSVYADKIRPAYQYSTLSCSCICSCVCCIIVTW